MLHRSDPESLWLRNDRGDVPLHEAVHSGRKDLVRWMLAAAARGRRRSEDAATAASNHEGRCPLHVAALNNSVEMCKVEELDQRARLTKLSYRVFVISRSCWTTVRT